jgi:hypothetical protein
MSVFVIDRHGKALMPCTEKRAKLLLARNSVRVHLKTRSELVQGISHHYCKVIQRNDGYGYQLVATTKECVN